MDLDVERIDETEEEYLGRIAANVATLRKLRGYTITQFAAYAGIAEKTIRNTMDRTYTPSMSVFLRLAPVLGVTPPELLLPTEELLRVVDERDGGQRFRLKLVAVEAPDEPAKDKPRSGRRRSSDGRNRARLAYLRRPA